jgi:hypothetical protein
MSKMGRPKLAKGQARGIFVSTRVSPLEYREITQAVVRDGIKKTEWVRRSLLFSARNCDTKSVDNVGKFQ